MKGDLISRSALCGKQEEMYIHTDSGKIIPALAIPVWVINNAPAIDAVEVVRCRDCKDYERGVCTKITYIMDGYYSNTFEVRDPDDFCSKGERKEE